MKKSDIASYIGLLTCLAYFITRTIYALTGDIRLDKSSFIFGVIIGILFLFIAIDLFFIKKSKKLAIKPFIISAVLLLTSLLEFIVKHN